MVKRNAHRAQVQLRKPRHFIIVKQSRVKPLIKIDVAIKSVVLEIFFKQRADIAVKLKNFFLSRTRHAEQKFFRAPRIKFSRRLFRNFFRQLIIKPNHFFDISAVIETCAEIFEHNLVFIERVIIVVLAEAASLDFVDNFIKLFRRQDIVIHKKKIAARSEMLIRVFNLLQNFDVVFKFRLKLGDRAERTISDTAARRVSYISVGCGILIFYLVKD